MFNCVAETNLIYRRISSHLVAYLKHCLTCLITYTLWDMSTPYNKHEYVYMYTEQDQRTSYKTEGLAACRATDNDLTLKFGSLISESIYYV